MSAEGNIETRPAVVSGLALDDRQQISLCEVLDRVLNKGVVVAGEATISVADIDLVYLGLQIVLTSMETARAQVAELIGAHATEVIFTSCGTEAEEVDS